ncbi:MAG TPA: hypothetical protein VGN20_16345 [Mucilaginibacter sp.]|jgi:hypothetical protein
MNSNIIATETINISDIPFEEYNKRQLYEISTERTRERAFNAKPSGNFLHDGNVWLPQEYEGYAVVSMLSDNEGNEPLATRLEEIQKELQYNLQPTYGFYQLPAESFHQTVANTLSAERFYNHILNVGLEQTFPQLVSNVFDSIPEEGNSGPLNMKMAGLSVFGTAIGMLGIIENEDDYNRVICFRSRFYGDKQLAELDVKMTRPFIGHVTLAYVEHILNKNQKYHLATVINEINESLSGEKNYFNISKTGLRRYHHLAEFIKQDNYPTYVL